MNSASVVVVNGLLTIIARWMLTGDSQNHGLLAALLGGMCADEGSRVKRESDAR